MSSLPRPPDRTANGANGWRTGARRSKPDTLHRYAWTLIYAADLLPLATRRELMVALHKANQSEGVTR